MDGLECTEILFSQLNAETRIDAEYFYKKNLEMQRKIENIPHVNIGEVGYVTDGIHTSIDYDENGYINLISATSPRQNIFNLTRNAYISEKAHKANPRTALKERDVIISTVGTIGNCAVVDKSILPANSDRHVGIIRLESKINPYLLSTFLLTKYGRNQTVRETTGNVQPNLFLYKIREIKVPLFRDEFQKKIEAAVLKAQVLLTDSNKKYRKSEEMLEKEIEIDISTIINNGIAVKSFAESFGSSGRLDAEYYHPKYEAIESQIYGNNTVSNSCKLFDNNFIPSDETIYQYIELSNVYANGEISDVKHIVGVDLPSRARRLVKSGQVIVSSVEGSLSSCALITPEYNNAICSTGFYVVSSGKYTPETLLILFKSKSIQSLLKKRCSGTILTAISKDELEKMPLPEISNAVQEQISIYVQECFRLRAESKRLLDLVVKTVEKAIETDEETALIWLNEHK